MGQDTGWPFSKTVAVNEAASRATGDIFVILDADAYISGAAIQEAADRIRHAWDRNHKLWLIPYRRLFRLTRYATVLMMDYHAG